MTPTPRRASGTRRALAPITIVGSAAALVVTAVCNTPAALAGVDRPPPLVGEQGCVTYSGQATGGNDSTVRLELRLCRGRGDTLTGVTQWSSLVSGWSERRISGSLDPDIPGHLVLKDEAFLESRPEPQWRFCLIDTYELTADGKSLTGSYVAEDCNDTAKLALEVTSGDPSVVFGPGVVSPSAHADTPKAETPQAPETGRSPTSGPSARASAQDTAPGSTPGTRPDADDTPPKGCACELAKHEGDRGSGLILLGLVAFALRPWRRRPTPSR